MNDVERAAVRAAEAHTEAIVSMLVDGDRSTPEMRARYTVEQVERLVKVYGGKL